MKMVLLAGPSASGKSTLAHALGGEVFSTSGYLRALRPGADSNALFDLGHKFDIEDPEWVWRNSQPYNVVDAIRSSSQMSGFRYRDVVRVNVTCGEDVLSDRHSLRGTERPFFTPFQFDSPDYTWRSDRVSLSNAVQALDQLRGRGFADVVIGAQYGSEGKGKLCALLAPSYDVLVRSGGPNAGHWVRDTGYEYCFHHIPSGSMSNRRAQIAIASGAAIYVPKFLSECRDADILGRLWVDDRVQLIGEGDRLDEEGLRNRIGSTSQGVGQAQQRRVAREAHALVGNVDALSTSCADVSQKLDHSLRFGSRLLLEGTQGSGLSLYHGPFPYVTSRDTNVGGLLAETGVAPSWVRDTWLVVRPFPIRVGGNSGPMRYEITWDDVAVPSGVPAEVLRERELTSTTKRLRRVGNFDPTQFQQAVTLNRPTRLFLTFADYLDPAVRDATWDKLPEAVLSFVHKLEYLAHCPVAGISTGRMQSDVVWRPGYAPASEKQS